MKKILTALAIGAGLFFVGKPLYDSYNKINIFERIDKNRIFSYKEYKDYEVSETVEGNNWNGKFLCVTYDFDRNGKIDAGANFDIINSKSGNNGKTCYIIIDRARMVLTDADEDKIIDVTYFDPGKRGFLEFKDDERYILPTGKELRI